MSRFFFWEIGRVHLVAISSLTSKLSEFLFTEGFISPKLPRITVNLLYSQIIIMIGQWYSKTNIFQEQKYLFKYKVLLKICFYYLHFERCHIFVSHLYTISRDCNVRLFYSTYLKRDNAVFLLPTGIRYKRAEKLLK